MRPPITPPAIAPTGTLWLAVAFPSVAAPPEVVVLLAGLNPDGELGVDPESKVVTAPDGDALEEPDTDEEDPATGRVLLTAPDELGAPDTEAALAVPVGDEDTDELQTRGIGTIRNDPGFGRTRRLTSSLLNWSGLELLTQAPAYQQPE